MMKSLFYSYHMREPDRCFIQFTGKVKTEKIIWSKGMLKGTANGDKTVFSKEGGNQNHYQTRQHLHIYQFPKYEKRCKIAQRQ